MAPEGTVAPADEPERRRIWPRALVGSLVIVCSMAFATATSGLLYLEEITSALGGLPGFEDRDELLAEVESGGARTFLIFGSDRRPEEDDPGRSDTTILLRVEPDPPSIRIFSLPRDLQVEIPGHGTGKLTDAYSLGGPRLAFETVRDLTGLRINHVVNIDFAGFAEAVNTIECVLVDIDRDYFNDNSTAAFGETYAPIDIDPGYQQLCGLKALQYVRYRHTDTDIVRVARQQDFLREARAKLNLQRLYEDRDFVIDLLDRFAASDIEEAGVVIEILKLMFDVRGESVDQVPFRGDLGDSDAEFVLAAPEQIARSVDELIGEEEATPSEPTGPGEGAGEGGGGSPAGPPEMHEVGAEADAVEERLRTEGGLTVIAPEEIVPGSAFSTDSRAYTVDTYDGDHYPAYRIVVRLGEVIPEYYGVQGVLWDSPPILDDPSESREIDGRTYDLYYDSGRLRMVAWHEGEASYWVRNTLLDTLSEAEMIALARSARGGR